MNFRAEFQSSENDGELGRLMHERASLGEAMEVLAIYQVTGTMDPICAAALQRGIAVIASPDDHPNSLGDCDNYFQYLDTMSKIIVTEEDETIEQFAAQIYQKVSKITTDLEHLATGEEIPIEDFINAEMFINQAHQLSVNGCSFGKTDSHHATN